MRLADLSRVIDDHKHCSSVADVIASEGYDCEQPFQIGCEVIDFLTRKLVMCSKCTKESSTVSLVVLS